MEPWQEWCIAEHGGPKSCNTVCVHCKLMSAIHEKLIGDKSSSLADRCEDLEGSLKRILSWVDAYPVEIFHEPSPEECKKAHQLLTANGMTLDAFSARMGRHCLKGVGDIARTALGQQE